MILDRDNLFKFVVAEGFETVAGKAGGMSLYGES